MVGSKNQRTGFKKWRQARVHKPENRTPWGCVLWAHTWNIRRRKLGDEAISGPPAVGTWQFAMFSVCSIHLPAAEGIICPGPTAVSCKHRASLLWVEMCLMEVGPTRSRILTPHKSSNTNKPKCVSTRIDLDFTCFNHSLICQQIYRGMIYLFYNPLILSVQFNNFSKFIGFCNHCYNLILEYLYHINNIPHAH